MKRFLPGLIFMSAVGCGCAASQEAKNANAKQSTNKQHKNFFIIIPPVRILYDNFITKQMPCQAKDA